MEIRLGEHGCGIALGDQKHNIKQSSVEKHRKEKQYLGISCRLCGRACRVDTQARLIVEQGFTCRGGIHGSQDRAGAHRSATAAGRR